MPLEVGIARTEAERTACEELIAQSFGRVMRFGIEDENAERASPAITTFFGRDPERGAIVAASRLVDVGYLRRSETLAEEYCLSRIPAELDPVAVLSYNSCTLPEYQGGRAMGEVFAGVYQHCLQNDIELTLTVCKPLLFPHFKKMGFRQFADGRVSFEGGYTVPLVLVNHDLDHLRACRSFFAPILESAPIREDHLVARDWCENTFSGDGQFNIRIIKDAAEIDLTAARDIFGSGIESLFQYCIFISCNKGDLVTKEGRHEQIFGFIVEGSLDVRKGDSVLGTLGAGEIFGELSFLLDTPRSASLVANCHNTRIVFVSRSSVDNIVDEAEKVEFWKSLSLLLAQRLERTTKLVT